MGIIKFNGIIKAIGQVNGGVSYTTEKPWKKVDVVITVIETTDRGTFENDVLLSARNDDVDKVREMGVGAKVWGCYTIRAHYVEKCERWFNDVDIWKIDLDQPKTAPAARPQNIRQYQATPAPAYQAAPEQTTDPEGDDLPF